MANFTVTRSDIFPNTTVIKAYPRTAFHTGQSGVPSGKSVAEATMTSGEAVLEGLTAGQEYTAYAEVAGKDAYLAIQAPQSSAIVAATGATEPQEQGLLGWSFDPTAASGTFGLTTAGTLYKARIGLKEQVKVSNILLWLTTKGATLTAAECFAGLFAEGTRKLVAKATAAETIAKWEATNGTLITIPLEAAVVLGPGFVEFGAYYNGTTKPTFASAVASTAGLINAGSTGKGLRFSSADTGLTTALPATMSETQTATASPIWVGLT